MDLTRVGSPFVNGTVVKVDPGDFYRKYTASAENPFPNEGAVGVVIGRLGYDGSEDLAEDEKSIVILRTNDDRIIRVHWSYVKEVTPLEALAHCAE